MPTYKWVISFGSSKHVYFVEYLAEQFARALRLNGTNYTIEKVRL